MRYYYYIFIRNEEVEIKKILKRDTAQSYIANTWLSWYLNSIWLQSPSLATPFMR